MTSVRTRFAPSPTGRLHVGGARTALLNWAFARHTGGVFVLRIEDTDRERNVPGAEAAVLDDLRWLGLAWDEGPDVGGPFGPYRQSERGAIYAEHAARLLATGWAYRCACPPAAPDEGAPSALRRRCPCADAPPPDDAPASLRFRVPADREVAWEDGARGRIAYRTEAIEDFVLLRADGVPTYNFAAAVDDGAMRITHVLRGADHIANTPKQLLLYEALGWTPPVFQHVPLILGPDRQKLSKRHGATSVAEHRRQGFPPEALVNYLSLLAWSAPDGEEFLPAERVVAEMDLSRVGTSDAVFDRDKLRWLSQRWLQRRSPAELAAAARPFVDRDRFPLDDAALDAALEAVRDHLHTLSEADEHLGHFVPPADPAHAAARDAARADPAARPVLDAVFTRLAALDAWTPEAIGAAVREAGRDAGAKGKALFLPLRLALTGREHGPELPRILHVRGREAVLAALAPPPAPER